MCVYTGVDTKMMMNLQEGSVKMSHLERQINKLVFFVVLMICIGSVVMSVCGSAWFIASEWDDEYLTLEYSDPIMSTISFFTYFLLLHTILPISLQVTIEIVKIVQARFIEADWLLYSFERDYYVSCKSASLVEEIGQINYLFSDKTGTLTRNVMEFKYMQVGKEFFGDKMKFKAGA